VNFTAHVRLLASAHFPASKASALLPMPSVFLAIGHPLWYAM
jgi:hypothetical protein